MGTPTAKHTPGPWSVGPIIHYSRDGRAITGDIPSVSMAGGCRALVVGLGASGLECAANAALIASAPDLLAERDRLRAVNAELVAALKEALAVWPRYNPDHWPLLADAHAAARAALRRAEESRT